MTIGYQHITVFILKIPFQPAWLRTRTTVCGTMANDMTKVTLSAVTYTQSTVNKKLQRHRCFGTNLLYLVDTQFSCKHNLFEADIFQKLHLFSCRVVALCRCMQSNRRHVHHQKRHILHDERVDTGIITIPGNFTRLLQLIVKQQSIECHVNFRTKNSSMITKFFDILDAVADLLTSAKTRSADIHRISAVVDGGDSYFKVLRWRKKFDFFQDEIFCKNN